MIKLKSLLLNEDAEWNPEEGDRVIHKKSGKLGHISMIWTEPRTDKVVDVEVRVPNKKGTGYDFIRGSVDDFKKAQEPFRHPWQASFGHHQ